MTKEEAERTFRPFIVVMIVSIVGYYAGVIDKNTFSILFVICTAIGLYLGFRYRADESKQMGKSNGRVIALVRRYRWKPVKWSAGIIGVDLIVVLIVLYQRDEYLSAGKDVPDWFVNVGVVTMLGPIILTLFLFVYIFALDFSIWGMFDEKPASKKGDEMSYDDFWQVTAEIIVPQSEAWNPLTATSFIKAYLEGSKAGVRTGCQFSLIGTSDGINWEVSTSSAAKDFRWTLADIEQLARAYYPDAQVNEAVGIDPYDEARYPCFVQSNIVGNKQPHIYSPIFAAKDVGSTDPLSVIFQTMANLRPGERLQYIITVTEKIQLTEKKIREFTTVTAKQAEAMNRRTYGRRQPDVDIVQDLVDWGFNKLRGEVRVPRPDWTNAERAMYLAKLNQPLYPIMVSMFIETPDEARLSLFAALLAAIEGFSLPPHTILDRGTVTRAIHFTSVENAAEHADEIISVAEQATETLKGKERHLLYMTTEELAGFWHLPYKGFAPGRGERQVAAPDAVRQLSSGIVLGNNKVGSALTPVHLLRRDRNEHMIVFGSTGTGKSTYLHNLIHQDIADGFGVAVIDPHGKLVADILNTSIPKERVGDVVVWDLANTDNPPPLNLLAIPPGFDPQTAVTQLLSVFNELWEGFSWAEMGDTLEMALMTLAADENRTLLDVDRVFHDEDYRWDLTTKLDDPEVDRYWERFEEKKDTEQAKMTSPVVRRLRAFYGNKTLRPILCHPKSLELTKLIAENKIILISLNPPSDVQLPPHSLELLGAVLVNQFQVAVMAGAARDQFYLYIDEAQRFVTTSIDTMFSEARKYKLSLTLSNQFLGQLKGKTLDAVMENVGAMTVFGCGQDSARQVAPYFKPELAIEDLVRFDKFQAAVRMRVNDRQQPPFTINTRPAPTLTPEEKEDRPSAGEIRKLSAQEFTPMTLAEVQQTLDERYPRRRRKPSGDDVEVFSDPVEPELMDGDEETIDESDDIEQVPDGNGDTGEQPETVE